MRPRSLYPGAAAFLCCAGWSLPGRFSGLNLVALMYVATQQPYWCAASTFISSVSLDTAPQIGMCRAPQDNEVELSASRRADVAATASPQRVSPAVVRRLDTVVLQPRRAK